MTPFLLVAALIWGAAQLPAAPAYAAETAPPTPPPTSPLTAAVAVRLSGPPPQLPWPDLHCPSAAPRPSRPATPPAEPQEPPDSAALEALMQSLAQPSAPEPAPAQDVPPAWPTLPADRPLRMAVWGDSHLAAGFFTDAIVQQWGLAPEQVVNGFVPANINRPGVRLPLLRKSCLSPGHWRHESAHVGGQTATGPGLVSLSSTQPGAWLALDLRNPAGQPERRPLRLLYHQSDTALVLALSANGGEETLLTLPAGPAGPASVDIRSEQPLYQLRLRLVQGSLRWHGLAYGTPPAGTRLQLDVFGFPGATVQGWQQADLGYLGHWFGGNNPTAYDLVMLEYGTNEGNVRPFNAGLYRSQLDQAVGKLRSLFPQARCVLIAPGDRGVLLRRPTRPARPAKAVAKASKTGAKTGATTGTPKGKKTTPPPGNSNTTSTLLNFSRIHAEIGRIQHQVAPTHGCTVWSMQTAMGGLGSAYLWQRRNPAWMARDLIHFTPAGYQQLGERFFQDMGWAGLLRPAPGPASVVVPAEGSASASTLAPSLPQASRPENAALLPNGPEETQRR